MKLTQWISSSLTRETMLKMGLRVSLIVVAVASLSYWHISVTLEEQTYDNLKNYITERGQKESAIFQLAEDNHRVFRTAFLEAWRSDQSTALSSRFDKMFFEADDGTIRLNPEYFDGVRRSNGTLSRYISAYVGPGVELDETLRRKLVLSYELIDQFAEGWSHRFSNLYVTMPENVIMIHWPMLAWGLKTDASLNINQEEWGYISDLAHNPSREPAWTGLFYDKPTRQWMVSLKTPVDVKGEPLLDIGHDILLNEVFERVVNDRLQGTYNFIFREDGQLIAHPEFFSDESLMNEAVAGRVFEVADLGDQSLENIVSLIRASGKSFEGGKGVVISDVPDDALLAVSRIQGPDWYFVTVYPKHLITSTALEAAYFIFMLGAFSILLEVLMLLWVLNRQVIRPIDHFVKIANKITDGEYDPNGDKHQKNLLRRSNEVGVLGRSLQEMAVTIQSNDERLEKEVDQRTKDLNKTNQALVGEIAKRRELEDKLRQQINIDALTGVNGRSYFLSLGGIQFKECRQNGVSLYGVMIDIDFFKNINDSYGHAVGDAALKQFARVCSHCLRSDDIFGRLGGEEFALILPGADAETARELCESIRQTLEASEIVAGSLVIKLTASFGCARMLKTDDSIDDVLNRADKGLYQAKDEGRNCVVMVGAELRSASTGNAS